MLFAQTDKYLVCAKDLCLSLFSLDVNAIFLNRFINSSLHKQTGPTDLGLRYWRYLCKLVCAYKFIEINHLNRNSKHVNGNLKSMQARNFSLSEGYHTKKLTYNFTQTESIDPIYAQ